MRYSDENSTRNPAGCGYPRSAGKRNAADNLSRLQPHPAQQNRSLSKRDIQAGWDRLELLALSVCGRGLLR